ncbi:MAG: hypothetical protein V4564_05280 [Pseudomonadota bacterium]
MRGAGRYAAAIIATALAVTTPAHAKSVYFHKVGVDREAYARDYTECEALAGGVRVNTTAPYSNNIYAAAAGGFFAGFFGSRERRSLVDNVLRTCMADKGYRRVAASDPVKKDLSKLKDTARVDRLFELAAAPTPEGEILPR